MAAAAAADASSTAPAASRSSVHGSATNGFPTAAGPGTVRLTISARSGPKGVSGLVRAAGDSGTPATAFKVSGRVTCLLVVGRQASIKYRFDQASGSAAALAGGGVEVYVRDNGHARGGQPVDESAFGAPMPKGAFQTAHPSSCDPPNLAPYSPVHSGHYTIHSSHPAARGAASTTAH